MSSHDSGAVSSPPSTSGSAPNAKYLPTPQGACPALANGVQSFAGTGVQIYAPQSGAPQGGSLVLFWHGTGGSASDVDYFLGQSAVSAITAAGGIVASFTTSTGKGTNTGDAVWYTGDFDIADEVVACAIQEGHIDPRRIYTSGDSAGGLQATWMAYARSGYIAAAAPISGGVLEFGGSSLTPTSTPQDPTNVPAAIVTHGAPGKDVVVIDFAACSAAYEADIAAKGGFSVDCNTGGGHVSGPPAISPAIWTFFQDHPFHSQDRYSQGLPSDFPAYCAVGPRAGDGGP